MLEVTISLTKQQRAALELMLSLVTKLDETWEDGWVQSFSFSVSSIHVREEEHNDKTR
jgi:hypothetical protein